MLVRFGSGPKDRRDTPDVLRRGTCFPGRPMPVDWDGVSSARVDEVVEPVVRFRLLIVTVDGTLVLPRIDRGEARGGVVVGAGSLERAF